MMAPLAEAYLYVDWGREEYKTCYYKEMEAILTFEQINADIHHITDSNWLFYITFSFLHKVTA